ncbi:MAG: class I SAM-dependent methyltransferase [Sphingomonadales bacterium]|nr:class I SAM-dependent methyltransferase [Sphingomonadales bacterium]
MPTSYDRVAYPASVFARTHPERLAVLARLAGLDAPAPETARVLEIGGGSSFNLLAIAAAWPNCVAHGFDLSANAIAEGQRLVDACGLTNVELAVEDICEAHHRYPAGSFDYVIAHGVYAWVPEPVRKATMRLISHVLSPRGVAFVSYNCMPGGHVRMILREMLFDAVGGIDDPASKIAATRAFLADYVRPRPDDEAMATALRQQAAAMLDRPDAVLFHDELGECFHPQRLLDVAVAAHENGLTFLTDAGRQRHLDGFLAHDVEPGPDADAAVLLAATRADYAALRYFRQSLFVRAANVPDRRIDSARLAGLWMATRLRHEGGGRFSHGEDTVTISDPALVDAIVRVAACYPQRLPVALVTVDPAHWRDLLRMFVDWHVDLFPGPAPFARDVAAHPEVSPLVRGMLAQGETTVCTLDHGAITIEQAELRALLMAADGTRAIDEIAALATGVPPGDVLPALIASAERALLAA